MFCILCIVSEIRPYHLSVDKEFCNKGYHVYEIRPPMNLTDSPTRLPVDLEYTNITDQHASLVWIPELTHFPTELHNVTTDVKRNLTK